MNRKSIINRRRWSIYAAYSTCAVVSLYEAVLSGNLGFWLFATFLGPFAIARATHPDDNRYTGFDCVGNCVVSAMLIGLLAFFNPFNLVIGVACLPIYYFLRKLPWKNLWNLIRPESADIRIRGDRLRVRIVYAYKLAVPFVVGWAGKLLDVRLLVPFLIAFIIHTFYTVYLWTWQITLHEGTYTLHRLWYSHTIDLSPNTQVKRRFGRYQVIMQNKVTFWYCTENCENGIQLFMKLRSIGQKAKADL